MNGQYLNSTARSPVTRWLLLAISPTLLFLTQAANASEPKVQRPVTEVAAEITPMHTHQRMGLLRNDIEQIRLYLGKRAPRLRVFKITNAEPRQVFFQAQTLFRKCNHLAMDFSVAERQASPSAPARVITQADVYALVESAHQQLLLVKEELGITEPAQLPRLERRRNASDVLHDIVEAGNVLNQLTMTPANWDGIYDRIVQMLTYLGGALPESQRYPPLGGAVCCKQPEDVYLSLAGTMRSLAPLAEKVRMPLLKVKRIRPPEGGASTSTVYDLTTTMVSDIGEITLRLENADDVAPPDYVRPTRVLPAHAWQLARVLDLQLNRLTGSAEQFSSSPDIARAANQG